MAMLSRGSEWHRWEPHIHTPGTLHADEYRGDWDGFLTALESAQPSIEAIGITDYCTVATYKDFIAHRQSGRASDVQFAFPNVEFRMDVKTEKQKGINLHLLFSPEDPCHLEEIERVLGILTYEYRARRYRCTPADLRALGRAADPSQADDHGALREGAMQFKLSLDQLRSLRADPWAKSNCFVAVVTNSKDGTGGMQRDGAFRTKREEIEALADFVLSPRPRDREFWLGEGIMSPEQIEKAYRSLKPCIHGSDAHSIASVGKPKKDRYCWIRAQLSFTGLRQLTLEPALRVHLGPEPPLWSAPEDTITSVQLSSAPWIEAKTLPINAGLVAIIGPKGTGKTALADLIGVGARAEISGDASFLVKASEHLHEEAVSLSWGGVRGEPVSVVSGLSGPEDAPAVRYLSQQFVERLCAMDGLTDALMEEVESVVFHAIPIEERLGASDFRQLRELRLQHVNRQRDGALQRISELAGLIADEEAKIADLATREKAVDTLTTAQKDDQKLLVTLVPSGKQKAAKQLTSLAPTLSAKQALLQRLNLGLSRVAEIAEAYGTLRTTVERDFELLQRDYSAAKLTDEEWKGLRPSLAQEGDVTAVLLLAKQRLLDEVKLLMEGSPDEYDEALPQTWSLNALRERRDTLTSEVGLEQKRANRYQVVSRRIADRLRTLETATAALADARGAKSRRKLLRDERRTRYTEVLALLGRKQATLELLYSPLHEHLNAASDDRKRLEFYVRRIVDVARWVARGESMLDARKRAGKQDLTDVAAELLLPVWQEGDASAVAEAMDAFVKRCGKELLASRRRHVSPEDLGVWLFSVEHIQLRYGVRYDELELSKLSPGMRGVVLMLLYLAIDDWDTRPLLVDQPEENLDPQSVYEELVTYFRRAKQRRQVILVTHNPNLVVNTDADQVIVASAERDGRGLPRISYMAGGLEDEPIRHAVCTVLEGGERAFRERERRYALPQDPRTES